MPFNLQAAITIFKPLRSREEKSLLKTNDFSTSEAVENAVSDEDLSISEWAMAIVIGYETGSGLTPEAKAELVQELKCDNFRQKLREELVNAGYGNIFGLDQELQILTRST
jgi:hypothetical protein